MRFDTLGDWLSWLESHHPTDIELGLERVAAVARRLDPDLSASRVISIAGTNGKGSCVAALEALCREAGFRVGRYTSPHLLTFNERIVIDGQAATDTDLVAAFDRVYRCLGDVSLTYFEFTTLAALDLFGRARPDILLLEVGLGGRLDAVNVVDADISVVTSVDLDHESWLGTSREQIGYEKAGIFRADRPAVCADEDPPQSLIDHARKIAAPLSQRGRDFDLVKGADDRWYWWSGGDCGQRHVLDLPVHPALPLPSLAAAMQVAEALGIDRRHWSVLATINLAGRCQAVNWQGRNVLLDVAHNPAAARLLARRLAMQAPAGRRHALFAAMADKDIAGMVQPLRQLFSRWSVVGLPEVPRAMTAGQLASLVRQQVSAPVAVFEDVNRAWAQVLSRLENSDQLVVFGSFYTVAAVLKQMQIDNNGQEMLE